jgi:DNA modification methylase
MDKDFKPVKSVYNSNYDAIKNIMFLYNIERFDLDCTYSKGAFWKDLPGPINKSDLYPVNDNVIQASSENLPFPDASMNSIMYDPPFVIAGATYRQNKEGSSIMAKRFEGYTTYNDLMKNYYNTLKELYRITIKNGLVVMKCQDTVSGGKNHFTHSMIMNMAMQIGFYPKDLIILNSNVRLNSFGTKWTKQEHARKYHSYFWVFQKTNPKVKYDFMKWDVPDSVESQDTLPLDPQPSI